LKLFYMEFILILDLILFRLSSEILKPLINRSHETIRNWYYRFNNISIYRIFRNKPDS
jgi:hypothetical protein